MPSGLSCQQGNMVLYFYYCPECFCRLQAGGKQVCENAIARVT